MTNDPTEPWPEELRLADRGRTLNVRFDDGSAFALSAEYLRVESPSAEVQGHGAGEKTTVAGKRSCRIVAAEPVGNYAVRLIFDDHHSTGIYTWPYLHRLGRDHGSLWPVYLDRLARAGLSRD